MSNEFILLSEKSSQSIKASNNQNFNYGNNNYNYYNNSNNKNPNLKENKPYQSTHYNINNNKNNNQFDIFKSSKIASFDQNDFISKEHSYKNNERIKNNNNLSYSIFIDNYKKNNNDNKNNDIFKNNNNYKNNDIFKNNNNYKNNEFLKNNNDNKHNEFLKNNNNKNNDIFKNNNDNKYNDIFKYNNNKNDDILKNNNNNTNKSNYNKFLNYNNNRESRIIEINDKKKNNSIYKSEVRMRNDREKTCYINVVIQTLYHFDDLSVQLKDFNMYDTSPKVIIELITLLSSYSIIERTGNTILKQINFRNALADYFKDKKEFQINQEGDPIELLNFLLNSIHTYQISDYSQIGINENKCEPTCLIHQLFYIDIQEKLKCKNNKCNYSSDIKYSSNYFIHLLNVSSILNTADTNFRSFEKMKGQFINSVNLAPKYCSKCNSRNVEFDYICKSTGKYLIFHLTWETDRIKFETLLKVFCMLNDKFNLSLLFKCEKERQYSFLSLILLYANHYISLFYDKGRNIFIIYDDSNIEKYDNWEEVVEKLLTCHFQPILVIYEDDPENNCVFSLNKSTYDKLLSICNERDGNKSLMYNSKRFVPIKNDEWDCEKCGNINKNNNDRCIKCNYVNYVITMLINQDLKNKEIANKLSSNKWKCTKCQNININSICEICGKRKEKKNLHKSLDYKAIKKYQDSSQSSYNNSENSKNNYENSLNNKSNHDSSNKNPYSDNPFDVPREETYYFNYEENEKSYNLYPLNQNIQKKQGISHSMIINNNNNNNENYNNEKWKCPICKTLNINSKCKTCGRRNNSVAIKENSINNKNNKCMYCQNSNDNYCKYCKKNNETTPTSKTQIRSLSIDKKYIQKSIYDKSNNPNNNNNSNKSPTFLYQSYVKPIIGDNQKKKNQKYK